MLETSQYPIVFDLATSSHHCNDQGKSNETSTKPADIKLITDLSSNTVMISPALKDSSLSSAASKS